MTNAGGRLVCLFDRWIASYPGPRGFFCREERREERGERRDVQVLSIKLLTEIRNITSQK